MVLPEGIFSSNWAAAEPVVELAKLTLTQRYILTRSCLVTILVTTVYKSGINPHGYLNNVNVHDIGCGVSIHKEVHGVPYTRLDMVLTNQNKVLTQ